MVAEATCMKQGLINQRKQNVNVTCFYNHLAASLPDINGALEARNQSV